MILINKFKVICCFACLLFFLISGFTVSSTEKPVMVLKFDKQGVLEEWSNGDYFQLPLSPINLRYEENSWVLRTARASRNILPPGVAAPIPKSFSAKDVNFSSGNMEKIPGNKILIIKAIGNKGWEITAGAFNADVNFFNHFRTKEPGLFLSFYAKTNAETADLRIQINGSGNELPEKVKNELARKKNTEKKVPVELFKIEESVKLGTDWKRYGVMFSCPKHFEAEFKISFSGTTEIELGGLQLEKVGEHPSYSWQPTPWIPGGNSRKNETPEVPAPMLEIPGEQGAIAINAKIEQSQWQDKSNAQYQLLSMPGYYSIGIPVSKFGNTRIPSAKLSELLNDGLYHWVVLSWDKNDASLSVDGKIVRKVKQAVFKPADQTKLYQSVLQPFPDAPWRTPPNGCLKEIKFYRTPLNSEEIKSLLCHNEKIDQPMLERPLRQVFYRDDTVSGWTMGMRLPETETVGWQVDIEGLPKASAKIEKNRIVVDFNPSLYSPGERTFKVILKNENGKSFSYLRKLVIQPAKPRDKFYIIHWPGYHMCNTEKLKWYDSMGINTICGSMGTPAYQNFLASMGFSTYYRPHILPDNPHPLDPVCQAKTRETAEKIAYWAKNYPWLKVVVLNSESYGQSDVTRSPYSLELMRKHFNIQTPPIKSGPGWENLSIRPKLNLKEFSKTGLVPDDYLPLRYLLWLLAEGDGFARTGSEVKRIVNKQAPWIKFSVDPNFGFPGRPDWADIFRQWHYPEDNAFLLGKLKNTQDRAKELGLKFCPIIGFNYDSAQRWLLDKDGKPLKQVAPGPDKVAADLWLTLGLTSDMLYLYNLEKYGPGKDNRWIRPHYYERIGEVLKLFAERLGQVIGPLPGKAADMAILSSFTNHVGLGTEQWWHAYGQALYTLRAELGRANVPYDMVFEEKLSLEQLKKYKLLYIPSVHYLKERTWKIILEWQKSGGKIMMDKQSCPALSSQADEIRDILNPKRPYLNKIEFEKWISELNKRFPAPARVLDGKAYILNKTAGKAGVFVIVNNAWKETNAPLSGAKEGSDIIVDILEAKANKTDAAENKTLKLSKPLKDTGIAQTLKLKLSASTPDSVVYSVDQGTQLKSEFKDGYLYLDLPLKPGQGRVLAVLPQAVKTVKLDVPESAECGKSANLNVALLNQEAQVIPVDLGIKLNVIMPDGKPFDASGIYRLKDGQTKIILRFPLDAPKGTWKVNAEDLASGISSEKTFILKN
jgi:hypothetical protein